MEKILREISELEDLHIELILIDEHEKAKQIQDALHKLYEMLEKYENEQ